MRKPHSHAAEKNVPVRFKKDVSISLITTCGCNKGVPLLGTPSICQGGEYVFNGSSFTLFL